MGGKVYSQDEMKKLLFIFGTRPEAIKMAPLIREFRKYPSLFETRVCVTGQHREMLDQVLDFFEIEPDYDLNLMTENQSLFSLTARIIDSMERVLDDADPDLILVQGDTTTAFAGALAGFYKEIEVAHVEAGLRSNSKYFPFPEEANRALIGRIADYHFAPTNRAVLNLREESISRNVFNVGNTGIDSLLFTLDITKKHDREYRGYFKFLDLTKRIILVTGHRRENFDTPLEQVCDAIKKIAQVYPDVEIVYPVHLNPNVRNTIKPMLNNVTNIHLIEPLEYPHFVWLMDKSYMILTDSGGIQEEAPSLGKPLLVLREVTERTEGIEAGTAILVGTEKGQIMQNVARLLDDRAEYERMTPAVSPYGDGTSSRKIVLTLKKIWALK